MSSSGIGPNRDSIDPIHRSEEIERVRFETKKGNKEQPEPPPNKEPTKLIDFVLLLIRQALQFLKPWVTKWGRGAIAESKMKLALAKWKEMLQLMMREDLSQDTQFLKSMSESWHRLLEESVQLAPSSRFSEPMRQFIQKISMHPKNSDYTFGYYLEEYAGHNWLPFPYMELLQDLHRRHAADPSSSLLSQWDALADKLLNPD